MYHPTQEPRGADPRHPCQNQPNNTDEYSAVVNLTNTRNQETQNSGNHRFTHCSNLPPQVNNEFEFDLLQKVQKKIFDVRGAGNPEPETRNYPPPISSCTT